MQASREQEIPAIGEDPHSALFRTRESAKAAWEALSWLAGGLPEGQHLYASKNLVRTCPLHPPWRHLYPCLKKQSHRTRKLSVQPGDP